MTILVNLLSFIAVIGILVTIHEFGHFWVARKLGVKVLRFSIGFGKPLWRRVAKDGTEYVIAAIPLGGYVKMLDEREQNVPTEQLRYCFNRKPVWSRIAIAAAGPIANFLFAIIALWLMYLIGVQSVRPQIASVKLESIAAQAKLPVDYIIAEVAGEQTADWQAVTLALISQIGQSQVEMRLTDISGSSQLTRHLDLSQWRMTERDVSPLAQLGIEPRRATLTTEVAQVVANSPAQRAGLQAGDNLVEIAGVIITDWQSVSDSISRQRAEFTVRVARNEQAIDLHVNPTIVTDNNGITRASIGIAPKVIPLPSSLIFTQQYGLVDGLVRGAEQTWQLITLSFAMIGKLLTGQIGLANLSGPVSIAVGAGASAGYGIVYFLSFLALISVNLGVFNFLPLPILDGGHLMYYFVELIRGKPVSERAQEFGFRIGAMILLSLTVFALFNDFMRL